MHNFITVFTTKDSQKYAAIKILDMPYTYIRLQQEGLIRFHFRNHKALIMRFIFQLKYPFCEGIII